MNEIERSKLEKKIRIMQKIMNLLILVVLTLEMVALVGIGLVMFLSPPPPDLSDFYLAKTRMEQMGGTELKFIEACENKDGQKVLSCTYLDKSITYRGKRSEMAEVIMKSKTQKASVHLYRRWEVSDLPLSK